MGLDGPCRLTHVMAEKASLQYAEFRVDFGELLFDVFGDLVVEVDAVAVHRHREGPEVLHPETIEGFGMQLFEVDRFHFLNLLGFQRRRAAYDGQIDGPVLFHGVEAPLIQASLADDGPHSILADKAGGETVHTRTCGGAHAYFFPLVAHFTQAGRGMDTGHPFKAHWRRVIVVKDVDLGQVPDAEQRAVEVDGVPGVQTADDLFGKRRREVMYLAHLLFLPC